MSSEARPLRNPRVRELIIPAGTLDFIHCDIRDKANVDAAFAETIARFGKLTILHNNAGGSTPEDRAVTEAPEEEFWRVIKLDLYGTFLCSKLAHSSHHPVGRWCDYQYDIVSCVERGPGPRLLHGREGRNRRSDTIDGS